MATQPQGPVRPRFGRVPGFGQRPRTDPGACPTCGALPACEIPEPGEPEVTHCRSTQCPDADWPHAYDPTLCPKI